MIKKNDISVYISFKDDECIECKSSLYKGDMILLDKDYKPICLSCADLDHLIYLPSGNAVLTTRAKQHSKLFAVVLKFSRARKRNERQGLLVEKTALEKAEEKCLADKEVREIRRKRDKIRREILDQEYTKNFAEKIRELYPNMPRDREFEIAELACQKYSGRVGRSASANELNKEPVDLAVIAHIRHSETKYDELLLSGLDKSDARHEVKSRIAEVIEKWKSK